MVDLADEEVSDLSEDEEGFLKINQSPRVSQAYMLVPYILP